MTFWLGTERAWGSFCMGEGTAAGFGCDVVMDSWLYYRAKFQIREGIAEFAMDMLNMYMRIPMTTVFLIK